MRLDILIVDDRWKCLNLNLMTKSVMEKILILEGLKKNNYDLSILACSNDEIKELNKKYFNKDTSTNILSWPTNKSFHFPERNKEIIFLGDIAISFDRCVEDALKFEKTFYNYVMHMLTHSILHLFGFRHDTKKNTSFMEDLEIRILNKLNIDNPYELEKK